MNIESVRKISDPAQITSQHLRALWFDLHSDWDSAHRIVQQMDDIHAMWIHAYLHRKEPDEANARYWYRRAGKSFPEGMSFEDEATAIINELPGSSDSFMGV